MARLAQAAAPRTGSFAGVFLGYFAVCVGFVVVTLALGVLPSPVLDLAQSAAAFVR